MLFNQLFLLIKTTSGTKPGFHLTFLPNSNPRAINQIGTFRKSGEMFLLENVKTSKIDLIPSCLLLELDRDTGRDLNLSKLICLHLLGKFRQYTSP